MIVAFASRNPEKNYGKAAWSDVAGTILATDYKAPPYAWSSMKKILPINTTPGGCAFALTATMPARAGITNLTLGGGHFPSTGVIEVYEESPTDKHDG